VLGRWRSTAPGRGKAGDIMSKIKLRRMNFFDAVISFRLAISVLATRP